MLRVTAGSGVAVGAAAGSAGVAETGGEAAGAAGGAAGGGAPAAGTAGGWLALAGAVCCQTWPHRWHRTRRPPAPMVPSATVYSVAQAGQTSSIRYRDGAMNRTKQSLSEIHRPCRLWYLAEDCVEFVDMGILRAWQ
jgi:hypothetical protein